MAVTAEVGVIQRLTPPPALLEELGSQLGAVMVVDECSVWLSVAAGGSEEKCWRHFAMGRGKWLKNP